ncbi:polysaccharide deacetylase family protein [Paenibacillus sp. N3/727]|uniref:polysaccharide deacetylase family protein n=1 Tax=Paenibacillus sp. N3/727 TaxID=2925845 RepID=UPI001F53A1E1|nr:polysaccharide deacetylase family protein [Paenibacillus sp. N3/727]UNK18307.1 polysaccharide deacetylase family protein [Paenibacillus sp. N3/727]
MMKGKNNSALDYRKKNRKKLVKTVVQAIILLAVGMLLVKTVFVIEQYDEPNKAQWSNNNGFIALSYFGVDRSGTPKLVAKKQLDQQLKALQDQGYVTISQQDILDFYQKGAPLPDKALFLSFEDGRNDSSLFAQPLLEKYNYKATFLSYANKMGNSDHKFLQPKDMLKMRKNGYWELGSNGYRLSYINIFDDQGRYIGVKDENELTNKEHVEYYNHYLMDFIRDENMIPVEDRAKMEARINGDYKSMADIYSDRLGFVPNVYMIMHANALHDGMNPLVADVNNKNIEQLFKMHFSQEGNAYNSSEDSLYHLSRVQPAPYWYTNHLLMKIQKDTGQKMKFVRGDEQRADNWNRMSGAAEFIDNHIVLTSPPGGSGMLYLKESERLQDIQFTAKVAGNVVGKQTIYVRYDQQKESFIRVMIENNRLIVEQKQPGRAVESLFTQQLNDVKWESKDLAFNKATVYTKEQTAAGAKNDEKEYPVNIQHTRNIDIRVQGDQLNVTIDKEILLNDQTISGAVNGGGVALGSEYSKQNKKDDIYDGVFDDVQVVSLEKLKKEDSNNSLDSVESVTVYNNQFIGIQKVVNSIERAISDSIDWAIDTF